jgi:hypothetical protein
MVKLLSKKLPKHFWNEDSGLTSMFILLCISNFLLIPFFTRENTLIFLFTRIIWLFLLITGITTISRTRSQMRIFSVIPVLLILVSVLKLIIDFKSLVYIDFVIQLSLFTLLIGMVLVKVFEGGSVTVHRVVGSVLAYMLIGNVWAIIYQFLFVNLPGSMQIPAVYTESGVANSVFLYFSYTTLTTTGYGEILPIHAIARTLVIIEQLIGVLYPVVLIGRLVSLVAGNPGTSEENKQ